MLKRIGAVALTLAALALPLLAQAHAMLERSDPAAGIVAPSEQAPRVVSLWFTEPVGAASNAISVVNSENRRVDQLNAHSASSEPSRVDVDLGELPEGAYLVRWRVISADSHVVRGSYWFAVGFAATPPASAELLGSGPARVSYLEVLARWLGLVSILFMAGAPLFRLALRLKDGYGWKTWTAILTSFVVAHCMLAAAQAQSVAELPLPQALVAPVLREVLLDSRFAFLWWLRLTLGVMLGILLCRRSTRLAALCAVPLLIATSLGSHAAGARVSPPLAVAIDSVHLAAAALWLGGLLELSRLPLAMLGSLVSRVSALFLPAVLVLIASGVFNSWEQVGTLSRLFTTAHGQSLLVKLVLLVPLLAIAAVNLLVIRPRVAVSHDSPWRRRFRIHARAEAVFVVLILLAVAVLATLAPAAQQMFPQPLDIARQASDLRIALRVDPAWVGVSRFRVELTDAEGRPPPDIRRVVLTFTMEGMNMGRTNVTLSPRGAGAYEAEGFYVGMPGVSQIGVAVNRDRGDRTAVFRMEVPDVNAGQFAGLTAALGMRGAPRVADAASGRRLYEENCVACHGESGTGNGPAAASLLPPPADLTLHARWHPDEQLEWFIAHGVAGTSMLGFAERLSEAQRRQIVDHLHVLAAAPTASALRAAPVGGSQLAPADAGGATPLSGRLAFGPDFDNNLWLLELPSGNPQPLTRFGPKEFSSNPAWSPDGRQIAFSYYRLPEQAQIPVPDGTDLYVMNADGSGVRALSVHDASGAALQYPAWSADGASIYASYAAPAGSARSIDRIEVKTGKRMRIVRDAAYPALSRDGRAIAYVRYATPPDRGESLWLAAPDGTRPREVVRSGVFAKYFGLRFSPDSRHLVFAAVGQPPAPKLSDFLMGNAYANGDLWDLWIVNVDGSELRPLTALGEDMPIAAWSPDGTQIAFLGGGSASSAQAGVTVVAPGRKTLRRLTTQPGHRGLDWR